MKIKYFFPKLFVILFVINIFYSCQTSRIKTDAPIVIPFTLENNVIVIQAMVNGIEGRYFFDTGGDGSLTTVPLTNLPVVEGSGEYYIIHWIENGISINNQIILSRSFIGNPVPSRPRIDVTLQNLQEGQFDGFLGAMVFSGYWCEVLFSENKIVLHKTKPDGFSKSVPMIKLNRTHWGIPLRVNKKEIYFLVDTGIQNAFAFPKTLTQQLETEPSSEYEVLTRSEPLHAVQTNIITVFDDTFTDKIVLSDSFFADEDIGMIGVEYLKNYDLLFDFTHWSDDKPAVLYYKSRFPDTDKNTQYISSFGKPRFGVGFMPVEQGVTLDRVVKPSVAYTDFGLTPGITITHINGKPLTMITSNEISGLFGSLAQDTEGELTVLDTDGQQRIIKRKKQ